MGDSAADEKGKKKKISKLRLFAYTALKISASLKPAPKPPPTSLRQRLVVNLVTPRIRVQSAPGAFSVHIDDVPNSTSPPPNEEKCSKTPPKG
ncbi:predicted protein [Histoplasma capsulatum var. duboisii H88]|uniref:Predicted protein n=1 Tax=Ajellomyces capsulatus (strain H88) TaxID=544711 RepID=F0U8H6_AJEC8|nr:predicted protein [Histoplasma capsulatum var. duboisii H88]